MESIEFEPPSFLSDGCGHDEINERILERLPEDLDRGEGTILWDLSMAVSLELSKAYQYYGLEFIRSIFPMWQEDALLLNSAYLRGLQLRQGVAAKGIVTVTGTIGTKIKKGSIFTTSATDNSPVIRFSADNEYIIDSKQSVDVSITCVDVGKIGNTMPNTIVLADPPDANFKSIVNKAATQGGFDEETLDELRRRVIEFDQNKDASGIGSDFDYRKWSMEVPGVGNAYVSARDDGTAWIDIYLVDSSGAPATDALCDAVHEYILSDSVGQRKAPLGAKVNVKPASSLEVDVATHIEIDVGYNIDDIKNSLKVELTMLFKDCVGKIKVSDVNDKIKHLKGILDYYGTTINGSESNVLLEKNQLVTCGKVTLYEG